MKNDSTNDVSGRVILQAGVIVEHFVYQVGRIMRIA